LSSAELLAMLDAPVVTTPGAAGVVNDSTAPTAVADAFDTIAQK
jgi:hypothetical protein